MLVLDLPRATVVDLAPALLRDKVARVAAAAVFILSGVEQRGYLVAEVKFVVATARSDQHLELGARYHSQPL